MKSSKILYVCTAYTVLNSRQSVAYENENIYEYSGSVTVCVAK